MIKVWDLEVGKETLPLRGHSGPVNCLTLYFLEEPIHRAQRKAAERGLSVDFLVKDALTLRDWEERFDTVIDSGVFHVFSDENRKRYVDGLSQVLKPGGKMFLICLSEEEPGTHGPRRVTKQELLDAFATQAGCLISGVMAVCLSLATVALVPSITSR